VITKVPLSVVWFLLGNSPASELYMPTFPPMKMEQSIPKRWRIKFRRQGITQNKAYNIQNTAKGWNQECLYFSTYINSGTPLEISGKWRSVYWWSLNSAFLQYNTVGYTSYERFLRTFKVRYIPYNWIWVTPQNLWFKRCVLHLNTLRSLNSNAVTETQLYVHDSWHCT
jgi:hypothetical protein